MIIKHFELFTYLPKQFIEHANKESHLILAIRLYLNGHYNKSLADYINQLAIKLIEKNHSFSPAAIELLFYLNDKLAFKELEKKTSHLTNCYVRLHAREGNIELFYQNDKISIPRMIQIIHLAPDDSADNQKQNQLKKLLSINKTEENPTLSGLLKYNKEINCFEYFLFHYTGNYRLVYNLLNDYMEFYEQAEHSKNRCKAMNHLGLIMTCSSLNAAVKEALFTAFLNHPNLFDEQISYQLFLYDAKRVIRYFGLRGGKENYKRVINLCTFALKNLNSAQHQSTIDLAQHALAEAQLELHFTKDQRFFSGLIKWIKRCWTYGWSGFFNPNLPKYVVPESLAHEQQQKKSSKKPIKKTTPVPISDKDLPGLVNEMEFPLNQEQFEYLIKALELFSFQSMPKEELTTRQKLHMFYHRAMLHKEENESLYHWLKDNQNPFIMNQFRLLELSLKEKSRTEINILLGEINIDSDQLNYVSNELLCIMPELIIKEPPTSSKTPATNDYVTNATKAFSEYVQVASEKATSAYNWVGKLFDQLDKKSDEETFEAEHVPSFQQT